MARRWGVAAAAIAAGLAGCTPVPQPDPCAGFAPIRLTPAQRASLTPEARREVERWNANLLRDCGIGAAAPG